MITYPEIDCYINQIEENFVSMEQTLNHMAQTMTDIGLDETWKLISKPLFAYENTLSLVTKNIKKLFEQMNEKIEKDAREEED